MAKTITAVDQAVAQVRKWAGHPDNEWAPDRQQCTALADEVEDLRARLAATGAERDRLGGAVRQVRELLDAQDRAWPRPNHSVPVVAVRDALDRAVQ